MGDSDIHKVGRGRGGWEGGGGKKRRWKEEKRGELGDKEEEQDNKAHDIQDTDVQQQCIVSRFSSFNESFVTLGVK